MSLRAGDGFRFPNQKYDDTKALYTNFRYMQEYLNRIWASPKGAPDIIVAAADSPFPGRADLVCNGENDEVQIVEAMNRLPVNGGWVHLMSGSYNLGAAIVQPIANVRLTGASGWNITGNNAATTLNGASGVVMYNVNSQNGLVMEHLHLDGGGVATGCVSAAAGDASDFVFNNVSMTDSTGVGLNCARSSSQVFLNGSIIDRHGGNGFDCKESTAWVANTHIRNNGNAGVHTEYGASFFITNSQITGNTGDGLSFGSPTQGSKTVSNCLIQGNGGRGIWSVSILYGPTIVIGNVISSNTGNDCELNGSSIAIGNWTDDAPTATISYGNIVAGVAQSPDHGSLQGLADDDHTQYHNDARAVIWHDADDHSALTVTEAQITDLNHNDTSAVHVNVPSEISAVTAKAVPTTSDFILIEDAADANAKKRITIGTLPGSASDHGVLTGLADDDHTQYLTEARHDARMLRGYSRETSTLNLGTSFTASQICNEVALTIPGDWNTWDLEAYSTVQIVDGSGGATSSGVLIFRHNTNTVSGTVGTEFVDGVLVAHELPGSNDGDNAAISWVNYDAGRTDTGTIYVQGIVEWSSGIDVNVFRRRMIVKAYKTS